MYCIGGVVSKTRSIVEAHYSAHSMIAQNNTSPRNKLADACIFTNDVLIHPPLCFFLPTSLVAATRSVASDKSYISYFVDELSIDLTYFY